MAFRACVESIDFTKIKFEYRYKFDLEARNALARVYYFILFKNNFTTYVNIYFRVFKFSSILKKQQQL